MHSLRSPLKLADVSRLRACCGMALLTCLGVSANAQTYQFTNGGGDSNWDTAANWLLVGSDPPVNAVPYSSTANALISGTQVNKVNGVIYLQSLTMDSGAGVNLYGGFNVFADLIQGGNLYLRADTQGNGGAFYTNGTVELQDVDFQCMGGTASAILPFPGSTLQVDADSTITGKLGLIGGYGDSALINYGTIKSDLLGVADPRFFIYPTLSQNYGTIQTGIGTSLNYYLNQHHNMDYGVITVPTYMACIATQFTNHALGLITVGGRTDVYAASQFDNSGNMTVQQLGIGPDSRVSNHNAGRIQVVSGTLDVYGTLEAGQTILSNSDLRTGDSTLLTLSAINDTPAAPPMTINNLVLDGGSIVGGKLNASSILSTNNHAMRLTGTTLNGTLDGTTTNVAVNLTGTTLAGGTIALKSGSNTNAYLGFDGQGANASTLENTTLQFIGTTPITLDTHPNSELTLGSNTHVTGNLGQIGLIYGGQSGSKITNNGTIQTTGAGNRTFLSPAVLINNGAINATSGASLNFGYGNNQVTNTASGVIHLYDNSGMVIYDGLFHNSGLVAIDNGILQIVGGTVDLGRVTIPNGVYAYNASVVNATQGVPNGFLALYNSVVGKLVGGQTNTAYTFDSSVLNVSGGTINFLTSNGTSTINISGGQIGSLSTSAVINVYGTNLTKRVVNVQNGAITYALNGTLADGTVWNNKTEVEYNTGHINVTNIAPIGSPASVRISEVKSLVHDGNVIRAQITVSNIGGISAQNVSLTSATLAGQSTGTAPLPSAAMLSPGASTTWNITFPTSASGTRVILALNGAFQGGRFGGSYRVTIP